MSTNPQVNGAVLLAQSGALAFTHAGGIVAITAALVGSLTLTNSAGGVTTIPAGSVGVFAVPPSGGATVTSWVLSSIADLAKVTVALIVPGTYL